MPKHVIPMREQARGTFLALLGVAAAWACSLPVAPFGFWWQVLAGSAVFLTTSATAGRRLFRLTREQAVEEAVYAVRCFGLVFGRLAVFTVLALLVLTRGLPRYA